MAVSGGDLEAAFVPPLSSAEVFTGYFLLGIFPRFCRLRTGRMAGDVTSFDCGQVDLVCFHRSVFTAVVFFPYLHLRSAKCVIMNLLSFSPNLQIKVFIKRVHLFGNFTVPFEIA